MNDNWIDAAPLDAVPDEDVIGIDVGGVEVALYKIGSEVFATSDICTHGHARLSHGFLEGCEIECPLHQGRFDVRNGKAMCAPLTDDLRVFPVKIENGRVFLTLE